MCVWRSARASLGAFEHTQNVVPLLRIVLYSWASRCPCACSRLPRQKRRELAGAGWTTLFEFGTGGRGKGSQRADSVFEPGNFATIGAAKRGYVAN